MNPNKVLYNSELYLGYEKVDYYCRDSLEGGNGGKGGLNGATFFVFPDPGRQS